MNKQRPIRAFDRVTVDGGEHAWTVLEVVESQAHLRRVTAFPRVEMRGVDVSRLTLTQDIA